MSHDKCYRETQSKVNIQRVVEGRQGRSSDEMAFHQRPERSEGTNHMNGYFALLKVVICDQIHLENVSSVWVDGSLSEHPSGVILCQPATSNSIREIWFDFFPNFLIMESSIPGSSTWNLPFKGAGKRWIGNLRGWETMILTSWWGGFVGSRCWHLMPQHAVLWFISHTRPMVGF